MIRPNVRPANPSREVYAPSQDAGPGAWPSIGKKIPSPLLKSLEQNGSSRLLLIMVLSKTALEKAFELARSGKCLNISELLMRLKAEGYEAFQIEGRALRKQLKEIIEAAKRSP